ncbi:MAG: ABC transporter permease subunit [Mycobacteriales bacterium]
MSLAEVEQVTAPGPGVEETQGGLAREVLGRLRHSPVAILGAALILSFVVVAVFAPLIAPYGPKTADLTRIRPGYIPGPSGGHLLGLDQQGRDELSRIIYGARQSLLIGVVATGVGAVLGIVVGLLAGTFRGWADQALMRLMDVMLAIPGLLFAIGLAALLGPSLKSIMIAIAVPQVPIFARLLRASMLSQRDSDYALAARSLGVRRGRIILAHVLPNSIGPVIVQATLVLATAIIDAAGLAFLGLGSADPAIPEWGRMLADSQQFLTTSVQLAIFPGIAIVLSVLGFNLLGESLRESLDPKLRR